MSRIVDNLLSNPPVKKVIMDLEESLGHNSPFNSVTRINAVMSKVKDPVHMCWVFHCIEDAYKVRRSSTSYLLPAPPPQYCD